ncbi:MAG: hypothetical protein ACRD2E_05305 [Terriglobales bacterium]
MTQRRGAAWLQAPLWAPWAGAVFLCSTLLAGQSVPPAPLAPAPLGLTARAILLRAEKAGQANDQALEHYAWRERDRQWLLDSQGRQEKVVSDKTYDVSQVGGVQYPRLVGEHGRPLSPERATEEAQKQARFVRRLERESPRQRARERDKARRAEEKMARVRAAIPGAMHLRLLGIQRIPAGTFYVIAGWPRRHYDYRGSTLKLLSHVRGRLWIDAKTYQVAQARITVVKTISWGWLVARIGPGGVIRYRAAPVAGYWFPLRLRAVLAARLFLVKSLHLGIEEDFSDYRRFAVSSRVIPAQR